MVEYLSNIGDVLEKKGKGRRRRKERREQVMVLNVIHSSYTALYKVTATQLISKAN